MFRPPGLRRLGNAATPRTAAAGAQRTAAASGDPVETCRHLHICSGCQRPFVVMSGVLATAAATGEYVIELTCNNCGLIVVVDANDDEMLALDLQTNFAQRAIETVVERLERDRMCDDAELLARALDGGHLLPEDF